MAECSLQATSPVNDIEACPKYNSTQRVRREGWFGGVGDPFKGSSEAGAVHTETAYRCTQLYTERLPVWRQRDSMVCAQGG